MPLRFEAIRFRQAGVAMYLAAIPAGELVRHCTVDRYDTHRVGKWKGYQRNTYPDKVRNLRDYFRRPGVLLPVAGLLNVRATRAITFSSRSRSNPAVGIVSIPDHEEVFVVDMQHRLEGIDLAIAKKDRLKSFLMPVVLTGGLDKIDEAVQFYIVNTKAKKLDVGVARRLMIEHKKVRDIGDIPPWELKAVQVAMILERISNQPWHHRIQQPNENRADTHTCTERGFVPTLRRFLKRAEYSTWTPEEVASSLVAYWKAVQRLFPEVFQQSHRYVLLKVAPGVNVMHRLVPSVFDEIRRSRHKITEDNVYAVLKPLGKLGSRFWDGRNKRGAKRFGAGDEAFGLLADYFTKKLGL